MRARTSWLLFGCSLCLTSVAQNPKCDRKLHNAIALAAEEHDPDPIKLTTSHTKALTSPVFIAEDTRLRHINASGTHKKVASITYDPTNQDGRYSLQMGVGQPLYIGNDLQVLTHDLNQAAHLSPGDTLYVNLINTPQDHLEALNRTLRVQQRQINDDIDIVPLGEGALDMRTRELLFSNPVVEVRESALTRVSTGSRQGWVQAIVDFRVKVGDTFQDIRIAIVARTSEVMNAILSSLHVNATVTSANQERTVAEIVSATRSDVRRRYKHRQNIDFDFRAEIGRSFMVGLPLTPATVG